jgi:hypothetical protein
VWATWYQSYHRPILVADKWPTQVDRQPHCNKASNSFVWVITSLHQSQFLANLFFFNFSTLSYCFFLSIAAAINKVRPDIVCHVKSSTSGVQAELLPASWEHVPRTHTGQLKRNHGLIIGK